MSQIIRILKQILSSYLNQKIKKKDKMKTNDQMTVKESLNLIYAYVTISTFVLMMISKITDNLGKALDFSPIVSVLITLNMVAFIAVYLYKKRHSSHHHHIHS